MQNATHVISSEKICFEGVQPLAFDGIDLWLNITPQGIEVTVNHIVGPNLETLLRKKYKGSYLIQVKGSLLRFQDHISWDQFTEMSGEHTFKPIDIVKPNALRKVLHHFMMDQVKSLIIRIDPDDPTLIEYILRFNGGHEMKQRVKRDNTSDVLA